MIRTRNAAALALAMLACACGGADEPAAAPTREVELDPNPPMSSSDIDAIVNQQRVRPADPPATTGNTSGAQGN